MKLGKSFWIKLGIESMLIVFSVLLALALNEYRAASKEDERTRQSMVSIRQELLENKKIIQQWQQIHQEALTNIEAYRNRAAPQDSLVVNHRFQFEKIFEGTLIPNIVRSTAWETAKSTGILHNFDLQLANSLSDIYDMQRIGVANSADNLIALIFERPTHEQERVGQTLMLFQLTITELVGQESYLILAYDDVIKKLDGELED
ncbi:hypothetical protein D770_18140 [Flammeovirgaceae bacterium 311]|nr:hypothetical protein D770_18140 [Flammeovirgaceae bacterium 311]